jgi:uncharacterized protein (UPF0332 family)
MRESSDFELCITFGEEEVLERIRNAEEFLKKAQEFTEKRL